MNELQDKSDDSHARSRMIDPESSKILSNMYSGGSPKPDGDGKVAYSQDVAADSGGSPKPDASIKLGYSTEL